MNFDAWKEIKKLIPHTKEKQKVIYKPMTEEESIEHVETNLESSNHPTNSTTQQLSRNPITPEQPSSPKELASIKDDSIGKHQLSSSINENYILFYISRSE